MSLARSRRSAACQPPARHGLERLYPNAWAGLTTAWHNLAIPGLPQDFELSPGERDGSAPGGHYARRSIQDFAVSSSGQTDRLAFIDKALPHAHYDLMASQVGALPRASAADVGERLLALLAASAAGFARFVSQRKVIQDYGLDGGLAHIALNCDPHTLDRASCQALKHFHLHYLYWTAAELAALEHPRPATTRLFAAADRITRRRLVDPCSALAARLLHERLGRIEFGSGVQLIDYRETPNPDHPGLYGCQLRLRDWSVLEQANAAVLLRHIHDTIDTASRELMLAFTGHDQAPAPWQRHPLLPRRNIDARLQVLGYSAAATARLGLLADQLKPLSPRCIDGLRRHPRWQAAHITLNQPCYSLNIYSPQRNSLEQPLRNSTPVYIAIQPKLFAAVGGAGSLSLAGVPSVHIQRGAGHFDRAQWRQRAAFQQQFVSSQQALFRRFSDAPLPPIKHLGDFSQGWQTLATEVN